MFDNCIRLFLLILFFIPTYLLAEETAILQRNLPNGDIETSYNASDGRQMFTVKHSDGSAETTTIAPDGTKTYTVQHKDGSVESRTSMEH